MFTCEEAFAYINTFIYSEKSPDFTRLARLYNLDRISHLLERLGNPHQHLKVVHVAGSKGKGSTATLISSILTHAGYRTGLFTSPHLVNPCERCCIDSNPIPGRMFADYVHRIKPEIEAITESATIGPVSFFEIYTALALCYFADERVDFAVVEVGLGGRLDATNIVHPLVSVITQISMEHTSILGNTLEAIAKEKAEIIKLNRPVVLAPQSPEVQTIFEVIALDRHAPIDIVGRDTGWQQTHCDLRGQTFDVHTKTTSYLKLFLPQLGKHQTINAATAITTIGTLEELGHTISRTSIYDGLKTARLPGRQQLVDDAPFVLLDGAHSLASAEMLRDTIGEVFCYEKLILIVGFMKDKDLRGIGQLLCPIANVIIATQVHDNPRALSAGEIVQTWSDLGRDLRTSPSVDHAISAAKSFARPNDLICITGSVMLIGETMQVLEIP